MRKAFVSLALVALAAVLVPSALGARVSVRVEGRTLSIFGSLETRFEAGANPMQALDSPACAASSTTTSPPRRSAPTSTRSAGIRPGAQRVGVQGQRRLAAGRRGPGSAERRRPRALVLGDVRYDRRSADAAPDPHRPQLLPRRLRERPGHGQGGGSIARAGGGFAPAQAAPASASTQARCGRRSRAPSARTRSGRCSAARSSSPLHACSQGAGRRRRGLGPALVTRDRGAEVVLSTTVPAGISALEALRRKAEVETRTAASSRRSTGSRATSPGSTTGSTS